MIRNPVVAGQFYPGSASQLKAMIETFVDDKAEKEEVIGLLMPHAGYRSKQCGPGRYLWETPHGLTYLVDHRGTRAINPDHARQMFEAGDLVELYFTEEPITIELDLAS